MSESREREKEGFHANKIETVYLRVSLHCITAQNIIIRERMCFKNKMLFTAFICKGDKHKT